MHAIFLQKSFMFTVCFKNIMNIMIVEDIEYHIKAKQGHKVLQKSFLSSIKRLKLLIKYRCMFDIAQEQERPIKRWWIQIETVSVWKNSLSKLCLYVVRKYVLFWLLIILQKKNYNYSSIQRTWVLKSTLIKNATFRCVKKRGWNR